MKDEPTNDAPPGAASVLADIDRGEPALPLAKAGRAYPVPASAPTVFRHVRRGATDADGGRVRLEVLRTPRGLVTSKSAIGRFMLALSGGAGKRARPAPTSGRRDHARAARELDAAGI